MFLHHNSLAPPAEICNWYANSQAKIIQFGLGGVIIFVCSPRSRQDGGKSMMTAPAKMVDIKLTKLILGKDFVSVLNKFLAHKMTPYIIVYDFLYNWNRITESGTKSKRNGA